MPINKPNATDEVVTDEEVFDESASDRTVALVEDENDCDVPRSDSAATVALDIDMDKKSVNSLDGLDDVVPEYVNLVSPEKSLETTAFISSDVRAESPIKEATEERVERSPENDEIHKNSEEAKDEDLKPTDSLGNIVKEIDTAAHF